MSLPGIPSPIIPVPNLDIGTVAVNLVKGAVAPVIEQGAVAPAIQKVADKIFSNEVREGAVNIQNHFYAAAPLQLAVTVLITVVVMGVIFCTIGGHWRSHKHERLIKEAVREALLESGDLKASDSQEMLVVGAQRRNSKKAAGKNPEYQLFEQV